MKLFNPLRNIICAAITLFFMAGQAGLAQPGECLTVGACTFNSNSQWPTNPVTITSPNFTVVSTEFWPGDFTVYNVVNGTTYEWSLCPADGGSSTYDAQLSLYPATGNVALCYSDDVCGNAPKIRWTANYTGTVRLQLNQFNCLGGAQLNTTIVARTVPAQNITDGEIFEIYTLGTAAVPLSNPQTIRAMVVNSGTTTLTNIPVVLNITGANTFTSTVTVPSINPGFGSIVTFSAFSPTNTGVNNISVTANIPNDNVPANNTLTITQNTTSNTVSYAYGSTIFDGLGFNNNGTGEIAAKFDLSAPSTISQFNVFFNSGGAQHTIRLYDATGPNGTPGNALFTTNSRVATSGLNQINLANPINVPASFYIAVIQTTGTFLNLGVQEEFPVRTATFFGKVNTPTPGNWVDFDVVETDFRPMIGAVLGCAPPPQPGLIIGVANPCQGALVTYSVPVVPGASSYIWTLPNGWTGSSTTNSIQTTVGSNSGNISVSAVDPICGTSVPSTLAVTVGSPPVISGNITGPASVCAGAPVNYNIPAVAGATSYNWTLPQGWPTPGTTNNISTSAGSSGGIISVTAQNNCGISGALTLQVAVNTPPAAPGNITGNTNVCAGTQQTYSVVAVPGATSYTWTLPNGWTGSSSSSAIIATAGHGTGIISVSANNECGSGQAATLSVIGNPQANATFTYPTNTFCVGSPNPIPSAASTGTYSATPAGLVFVSTTTGEINIAASTPGTYTITFLAGGNCPASSSTTVNITSAPSANFTYAAPSFCKGSQFDPTPNFAQGSSGGVFSAIPAGLSISASGVISLANSNAGTYTVTNTIAASGSCPAASSSTTVTIHNQPTATVSGGGTVCAPLTATVTITLTGTPPYNFTYLAGAAPTNIVGFSNNTFIINAMGSAVYTVSTVSDANCTNIGTGSANVVVNQPPVVTYTPIPNTFCSNQPPFSLSGGTPAGGTYTGQGVSGGSINPAVVSGPIQITYTYTDPITSCSGSATGEITVYPAPNVTLAPFTDPFCIENGPIPLFGGLPVGGFYTGSGVSNNILDPVAAGVGSHPITYTYVSNQGCADSAVQTAIVDVCTSLETQLSANNFEVYPIPAQDMLSVSGYEIDTHAQVLLVATNGKLLNVLKTATENGLMLQVGKIPSGVYRLIIHTGGSTYQKNVVIQ